MRNRAKELFEDAQKLIIRAESLAEEKRFNKASKKAVDAITKAVDAFITIKKGEIKPLTMDEREQILFEIERTDKLPNALIEWFVGFGKGFPRLAESVKKGEYGAEYNFKSSIKKTKSYINQLKNQMLGC